MRVFPWRLRCISCMRQRKQKANRSHKSIELNTSDEIIGRMQNTGLLTVRRRMDDKLPPPPRCALPQLHRGAIELICCILSMYRANDSRFSYEGAISLYDRINKMYQIHFYSKFNFSKRD